MELEVGRLLRENGGRKVEVVRGCCDAFGAVVGVCGWRDGNASKEGCEGVVSWQGREKGRTRWCNKDGGGMVVVT